MPRRPRTAKPDVPDLRDRYYEPALIRLEKELVPDVTPDEVLDQGQEGACTGFSLAATVNHLNKRRGRPDLRMSPRMFYEMAKRFDEWDGVDYEGSSLRGAIRGWKNNGVCTEASWPYRRAVGRLTIHRAKEAREHTVGAYYRLRPEISDFHTALNQVGVIAVSAEVHAGWDEPREVIRFRKTNDGGHAFILVGYDDRGFWVQNSWGPGWGKNGLALWTYEDWARNMMDAWVVRLALPTPQIFGVKPRASVIADEAVERKPRANRAEIAGHFVHVDDGAYKERGRYWSADDDIKQTAELVAKSDWYDHVLVYVHGGLNTPDDSARRIKAMKDGFLRNKVYPFHLMYDTGLAEELSDMLFRKGKASKERVGGLTDWLDRRVESLARPLGTRLWEEMKKDARVAFAGNGAGKRSLQHFLRELRVQGRKKKKLHLVGHSTGAVVIAHLLDSLRNEKVKFETCSLLAPACQVELYAKHYVPALTGGTNLSLRQLQVLNLSDRLEQDDNVAKVYRKSLLYLVSNAFERVDERPILGMQKFTGGLTRRNVSFHESNGRTGSVTRSTTHGGFDNDVTTMNHVLKSVLGRKAGKPFEGRELEY